VGEFYTPTPQVENNKDNDGAVHSGSLDYYRTQFPNNGVRILSEYNLPLIPVTIPMENTGQIIKQGSHTLIVFATEQALEDALVSSKKLVKNNVYI
jgi:hypothetical protein